jgi:hypothetical protein
MLCIHCGIEFTPAKINTKFCTASCRTKHWKAEKLLIEPRKTYDNLSHEELKKELLLKTIDATKIIKSFDRLFKDFEVWQDHITVITSLLEDDDLSNEINNLF